MAIRLWLASLAAFLAVAALAIFGPWQSSDTAIIAHRGASAAAPENTIAALNAATEAGADVIEIDVRLTADGVPVLLHDATLERTTDAETRLPDEAPWRVADLTLAEIRTLDAGSWKAEQFAGEQVPTLDEIIVAAGKHTGLLIELKAGSDRDPLAAAVAEQLAASDAIHRATVQSFDADVLAAFTQLAPDVATALVTSELLDAAELRALAELHDGVTPNVEVIDEPFVDAAQDLGLAVRPYTVNDPQTMRRLVDWGVDGIITDRPDRLRSILDSSG